MLRALTIWALVLILIQKGGYSLYCLDSITYYLHSQCVSPVTSIFTIKLRNMCYFLWLSITWTIFRSRLLNKYRPHMLADRRLPTIFNQRLTLNRPISRPLCFRSLDRRWHVRRESLLTAQDEVRVEDAQGGLVGALLVVDPRRDDQAEGDSRDALQHDQTYDQKQGAFVRHLWREGVKKK